MRYRRHRARLADKQLRENRMQRADGVSLTTPLQAESNVTPIIRYRHACNDCGNSFIADSQEATCRNCGGNNLNVGYVAKTGARD